MIRQDLLRKIWEKLSYWALNRPRTVLAVLIGLNIVFWTWVCFWKYKMYLYNGFDLAYFNQIFWNMLNGQFFTQSLHPHSSLGDHAGLIAPVFLPLYSIWSSQKMLLLLQQIALSISAWPLYLLAKRRFLSGGASGNWLKLGPLLIAVLWLMNPAVQHIGLFEFHLLPFALFPLFFALLAYDKGRIKAFLIWAVLAMLVREDVAMVIFLIGILAWAEKKKQIWRWVPPILATVWFLLAMKLISYFSPDSGYKFMVYYSWLGDTPLEAFINIFSHPIVVIKHIFTLANLEMALGLLMPLFFLPFLAPRALILVILPLAQIILGAPGGGEIVLKTHYSVLFLPGIFLAGTIALIRLPQLLARSPLVSEKQSRAGAGILLAFATVYSCLTLGPWLPSMKVMLFPKQISERAQIADKMLAQISEDASVVAGYGLLPALSSREEIYSLHYQFLGVSQYAISEYELSEDVRYVAVDTEDFMAYAAQFPITGWSEPYYDNGFSRLRNSAGKLVFSLGHFQLYDRLNGSYRVQPTPAVGASSRSRKSWGDLAMSRSSILMTRDLEDQSLILEVKTSWGTLASVEEDWHMVLRLVDENGEQVWERIYPFGNGLIASTELSRRPIGTKIKAPLLGVPPGKYQVQMLVTRQNANAYLNGIDSVDLLYSDIKTISTVNLGEINIIF